LNNHTYIGEVKYKNAVCKGEQDAIITREVWDRTREILKNNNPVSDYSRNQSIIAPLKGLLKCGHCGCAMMPTYGRKGARKYFYYLCSKDSHAAVPACPVHQIPAGDIEEIVRVQLKRLLSEVNMVNRIADKCGLDPLEILNAFQKDFWQAISPAELNRLTTLLVEKAVVWENRLQIEFKTSGIKSLMEELKYGGN